MAKGQRHTLNHAPFKPPQPEADSVSLLPTGEADTPKTMRKHERYAGLLAETPVMESNAGIAQDNTDSLLEMARSGDPVRRAHAISALAIEGRVNDNAVRRALEAALADDDPRVRAQAVSSLARRERETALPALQMALQDSDASVRLMVVDNAGNHAELLQPALDDSDATVRKLASMKLEEIAASSSIN